MSSNTTSISSLPAAPSRNASRSPSVMAAATQRCPWPARSGPSALTTPPAPRRASKEPSGRRTNVNGPRCETMIMPGGPRETVGLAASSGRELREEPEPILPLACGDEVLADVLASVGAHHVGARGVGEQLNRPLRAFLHRVDEVAVETVANLERDDAGAAADPRPTLPEALAHGEPESFSDRFLHDDVGGALERVDLHVADLLDVRQEMDVPVAAACLLGLLPDAEGLGVVGCHRSREHELSVGHLVAHDAEGLDDADGVLPRIEPAHLAHEWPTGVDPVLLADLGDERRREIEVLDRQRVDARWCVHD